MSTSPFSIAGRMPKFHPTSIIDQEADSCGKPCLLMLFVGISVLGLIIAAIKRVFLHSLSHIPGSKFAALTMWYEFYFDVFKQGQYIWQIQDMHVKYGPIVRINPYEVHIKDSEFYDDLYCANRKLDKYEWWCRCTGTMGSVFATVSHDHHRLRRAPLQPFFSARSVAQLENQLKSKIDKLSARLSDLIEKNQVVRFDAAFMALTMDTISDYAFGKDSKCLDEPDLGVNWREIMAGAVQCCPTLLQLPWLASLAKKLPVSVVSAINHHFGLYLEFQSVARENIRSIVEGKGEKPADGNGHPRTIFHAVLDSNLPAHEKTIDRLCDEGSIIMLAGSETTAQNLGRLFFYLKHEPRVLAKVRQELDEAIPDPNQIPSWGALQQLPYLSATIKEGIRMSYGVSTRLPRISDVDITYKGYIIPAGTPVSSTPLFVLTDPALFPQPETFRPERWIEAAKTLDKYFVAFNKGSRQCLGINLAYSEIYLTVATLVRRFDWEMYETTLHDVVCKHDFMVPGTKLDSKGVRGKITARRL
ncbi:cytochrome P450 monooxygenase sdnE [Cladorrhinum sp. PSN259]|nr:cytochrome P450 monooxygenase sdnE [Cladorrhinum sp. PSN259]